MKKTMTTSNKLYQEVDNLDHNITEIFEIYLFVDP